VTRVINQSFVRSRERLGTRCAIVRLRRAYPETPYEVVELASFKHTLEMAVKTKRSSVRTALLATASLAALAQGANAAITFEADSGSGGTAFPASFSLDVTINGQGTVTHDPCTELIFLKSTGALVAHKTYADAADKTLYAKGRARTSSTIDGDTLADFSDCNVLRGYYIHTAAPTQGGTPAVIDGTGLRIEAAPAGWYAPGGDALDDDTNEKAKLASELTVADDGTGNSEIAACAAGTFNYAMGATSCSNCPSGTFSAIGATVCTPCPEGTFLNSPGDAFCANIAQGYYGAVGIAASAHATVSKCAAGTTSAATDTGTATKCAHIAANYYGTVGTSTAHATVAACPTGTISAKKTSAGTYFCDGIAEGYYGMLGFNADGGYHAVVTACPAGSTSDGTAAGGSPGSWAMITDCKTKPGYYLSTAGLTGHVAGTITQAPAGFYATGDVAIGYAGPAVVGDTSAVSPGAFSSDAKFGRCPANANSEAGATFCVCDAGYAPVYDMDGNDDIFVTECAPISGYVASPTTADSAGASTPIAVALAAAAAVPLLL